jgi:hypothetical protein
MIALFAILAAADGSSAGNLLMGLSAPVAVKARNVERMTDGSAAEPGDAWDTFLTSIVEKDGSVTWDFGQTTPFEGVWIQADNNDVYVLSTSDDGQTFTPVWESSTMDNAGMQTRSSVGAGGRGRYLRLTAKGGDGMFSVGELAVFKSGQEARTFVPKYVRTAPEPQPFDGNWVVVAVVLIAVVALVKRLKPMEAKETVEAKEEPPPAAPPKE